MLMISRKYSGKIHTWLKPGKVLVLYGPRRVGKTTLIEEHLSQFEGKVFFGTGDDRLVREILESESVQRISTSFRGYDLVVIDEAQRVANIGQGLKIAVDALDSVRFFASGSSSFALSNLVGEPLTGRKKTLLLYPFSMGELVEQFGPMHVQLWLEDFLIFGTYPEVYLAENREEKISYLSDLRDAYLFKDILELENLKNPRILQDLLNLLAFQIGKEVSLNELSNSLGIAKQTVSRYLDLLEKVFVIKKVRGYSRNLRKEVTKTCRYYFIDNGVRNAVINNFNFPENRNDVGMLWENYLFSERMKTREYHSIHANAYFWRTYQGQEVDLVEERGGRLYGYEFRWGTKKKRQPKLWRETYPESDYKVIDRDNYLDFLIPSDTDLTRRDYSANYYNSHRKRRD